MRHVWVSSSWRCSLVTRLRPGFHNPVATVLPHPLLILNLTNNSCHQKCVCSSYPRSAQAQSAITRQNVDSRCPTPAEVKRSMTKRSPTSTYVIQVLVKSSTENAAQIVSCDSLEPRSAEPTRCSSGSISLRSRASRGTFETPRIGTFDRFGPQITQHTGVNNKRDPVPIFPRFLFGFKEPMWRSL